MANFWTIRNSMIIPIAQNATGRPILDYVDTPRVGIITGGQSNLGTGQTTVASDLESQYKVEYTNIKMWRYNAAQLNTLTLSNMNYADNPSYQTPDQNATYSLQFYLYTQIQTALNKVLHVIHHGIGATGLAVEWKPTATVGQQYADIVFKTQSFIRAATRVDGVAPSMKFLLWVQGEYDARVQAYADAYETNMTNFITNFRTATGLTTLPVIIVKLNTEFITAPSNPGTYGATVRTAEANVDTAMSNVYTVESDGATMRADKTHYEIAGEHTLADRIMTCITTNNLLA